MHRKIFLAALAALSVTAISSVYAAKSIENDALTIESAKISLTQAITTAEQHASGKAVRAEFEEHKGQWLFDVEVVNGKKVMDVKVDSMNGKVISVVEDKTDKDDDHDQAD